MSGCHCYHCIVPSENETVSEIEKASVYKVRHDKRKVLGRRGWGGWLAVAVSKDVVR